MNTPVSFELAKLLKEKGFDEVSQKWYSVEGGCYFIDEFNNNRGFVPAFECEAPTIVDVIMWLYEKHDIWIQPYRSSDDGDGYPYFWCEINNKGKVIESTHFGGWFESPTEAYEAAIEYTLNNLI